MKSFCTILIILSVCCKMNCQQGFYLKPLSYRKCFFTREPFNMTLQTKAGNTFQFETQNFVTPPGFDIGLLVGYNFTHFSFETGIIRDGSASGFNLKGFSYNRYDSTMSGNSYSARGALGYYNFPLLVYWNIFEKDNLWHNSRQLSLQLSLFGGINIGVFPSTDKSPVSIDGTIWEMSHNQYIDITDALSSTGESSARLYTLGISMKVYKKGINLFNFSLWGSLGSYGLSNEQLSITDTDGTKYRYNFYGNGSGIYLSWTKEINLRNMRHHIRGDSL